MSSLDARCPRRHLAGRGQVVLVGARCGVDRQPQGRAVAPRADAARPPRHPAPLGSRRAGARRVQGLGHGWFVPPRVALRHPHRGGGHALSSSGADLRRDPRYRRCCGAVRDVRPRPRQRPGAHRPRARRPTKRSRTASSAASFPTTSSTRRCREMAEQIAATPAVSVKMAREVIKHLAQPADPRVDERRDDLPDVHQSQRRLRRDSAPLAPKTARRTSRGAEHRVGADWTARTARAGCHRAPGGNLRRCDRVRHRRRHRPRQGHRRRVRTRWAPTIVIASRKAEHLDAGRAAIEAIGAPVLTVACDIRDDRADRGRLRRRARRSSDCPACSSTTRPRTSRCPPRTCRRTRGARSSTSR